MFDSSFGLDSLDGGPAFGAGVLPALIIGANGLVINRPPGSSDAEWEAVIQQNRQQQTGTTILNVGTQALSALLTTIATIAALELQRTGQVSAQTQAWQAQLAQLQGSTGGGQYLTADQLAQLQGLQQQADQQQAALTPWYKDPAIMVPLAIVGGLAVALGTAVMVRGRANHWDGANSWDGAAAPWASY